MQVIELDNEAKKSIRITSVSRGGVLWEIQK